MKPQKPSVFAFGSFLFDPEDGQLSLNGIPVRVNRQIVELLELLVVNAGQLVTREQIRQSLWPDQEFLNHEKIITNAISRLRHILRDNPADPKYIESVPKRGYRLVVKVQQLEVERSEPAVELASVGELRIEATDFDLPQGYSLEAETIPRRRFFGKRRNLLYAVALVLAGVAVSWRVWMVRRAERASAAISLGVAPFETSGVGAKELAESFRLDLTDSLAQLPHVNVRAAHSLELFSLDAPTFRERANKLGLDALLLGRFTLEGNECHVQLELVRGKDLVHIATFQHTVSRDELAGLRDKIQMETFASLKLAETERGESPPSAIGGTSDPRAYDAYLRAGYHLAQQTKDSLRLALKEYTEAVTIDPHFAKAYARRARTYFFLEQNNLVSDEEGFRESTESAQRALELDPASAEAHAVLGIVDFMHGWNLPAGEKELRQAISIDPNQPFYHQGLALIFCDEARFPEAFAEIDLAHANDPFWVSAYVTEAHVASVGKDVSRVQSSTRKLMELMPESPHARDGIGNAEWNIGRYVEAIAAWRAMAVIEGDRDRMDMEDRGLEAFRRGGVPAYARVRLEAIASGKGVEAHTNDFVASEWYGYAGDTGHALASIRAAIAKHDSSVLGLAVLPAYDSLQKNAEYEGIVRGLGLEVRR